MEAMLGIFVLLSLSQTSKNAMPFLLSLFSLQQNWRMRGQKRFSLEVRRERGWEGGRGERCPKQCIYI
jgi:hypothetical protein